MDELKEVALVVLAIYMFIAGIAFPIAAIQKIMQDGMVEQCEIKLPHNQHCKLIAVPAQVKG